MNLKNDYDKLIDTISKCAGNNLDDMSTDKQEAKIFRLYTDDSCIRDRNLIYDVEELSALLTLENTIVCKEIIKTIDGAEYVDREVFKDRFGRGLMLTHLSTTTKILLALLQMKDYVINITELGTNGVWFLSKIGSVSMYTSRRNFEFISNDFDEIYFNNEKCEDILSLNLKLWEAR